MRNGNKYFMLLLIMILSTFQFTCSKQTSKEYLSKDFPNILNVKNIPQQEVDWSAFCFSDKGSWFGFALPPDNSANYRGSFVGPFLMSNGSWLSQNLIGFKLYDFERKKEIDFAAASGCDINYYPGLLRQKLDVDGLKIQLDLRFVTNQTACIRAMIFNNSTTLKTIRFFWEGSVFNKNAKFEIAEDEIQLKLEDEQLVVMRPINNSAFTNDYSVEKNIPLEEFMVASEPLEYVIEDCIKNQTVSVQISLGVASTEQGIPGEELIVTSDLALYKAKDHGRNQAVLFDKKPLTLPV